MEWKSAIKKDDLIKIPNRWLHLHYYEAFNILFRFENSLRVFIYAILKNDKFNDWKTCKFQVKESQQSISSIAKKRISQAQTFGYLGYEVKCPIMHLTSGELVELMIGDAYWPLFNNYFKGSKEIIKNKLLEIGSIRNSLAHFRPIKKEDVELVKQNSRHTLISVEECLRNLFYQRKRVPTNTEAQWYKNISVLGTDHISTNLLYSQDEQWINIQLIFKVAVLRKTKYRDDHYGYDVIRLNTPNIVAEYPQIGRFVTQISEFVNYPTLNEEYMIDISKEINLVFKKSVLTENHEEVTDNLKTLLSKVTEEHELLTQDHLARGQLLEPVSASAWTQKTNEKLKWVYSYSSLECPYDQEDPDEYWGTNYLIHADIISGVTRYPWMTSDISKFESLLDL